jgi:ABC-type proline/glycine betaine transport system substrate-binding protein
LLALDEVPDASPPPIVGKRRPGPKHPNYGIPAEHWPTVVQRVVEQKEPLRTVAAAYGVSHETIRRIMHHVQKQGGKKEA